MACGEGYGADVLARTRRVACVGVDANPEAHEHARLRYRARQPALRARHRRDVRRAVRRRRLPADDRARPGPGRGARALHARCCARAASPTSRRRTCSRSRPRAPRARATRGTSRSTAPRSSARCARRTSRTVELYGLFHARKLRVHELAHLTRGLGRRPRAPGHHQALLRLVHAGDLERDFALRRDGARPRPRARLPRGLPPVRPRRSSRSSCTPTCRTSRASAPGRSARSGCGRRSPRATCRCSTCSSDGAPVTLSLTPVLCRPARALRGDGAVRRRCASGSSRSCAACGPTRTRSTSPGCASGGENVLAASSSAPAGDYERAAERSRPWAATCSAALRAARRVDLGGHPRGAAAAGHRRRRAPAARGRHRVPPPARFGRGRGAAASGCPSARTRRGWTRCSRTPACTRRASTSPTSSASARAAHLRAAAHRRPGRCSCRSTGPTIELVWSDHGYPADGAYRDYHHHTIARTTGRGPTTARPTTTRTRSRWPASTPPTSSPARSSGWTPARRPRSPALLVCALDTELLGHWWYEGAALAARRRRRVRTRQGLALTTLDDALARHEPEPAPPELPVTSWGARRATCRPGRAPASPTSPGEARDAELRVVAAGAEASDRAVRELLRAAVQRLGVPGHPRPRGAVRRAGARASTWMPSFRPSPRPATRLSLRNLAPYATSSSLLVP